MPIYTIINVERESDWVCYMGVLRFFFFFLMWMYYLYIYIYNSICSESINTSLVQRYTHSSSIVNDIFGLCFSLAKAFDIHSEIFLRDNVTKLDKLDKLCNEKEVNYDALENVLLFIFCVSMLIWIYLLCWYAVCIYIL